MNRPRDEENRASAWFTEMMQRLGKRYGEAHSGDLDAFTDVVALALRAAGAVERLRARHPEGVAVLAKAFPAWPVALRTGTGEAERWRALVEDMKVGGALSSNRAERGEWPDENLAVNRAAKEIRKIVRQLWNEDADPAQRLGPLATSNARGWFTEAWARYLAHCGGDLGKDEVLQRIFDTHLRAELKAGVAEAEPTLMAQKPARKDLEIIGREREIEAGNRERERQREERSRASRDERARRNVTKRLRGEVLRSFERWLVVEVGNAGQTS